MPFSGGWSPSPERYGSGEGGTEEPLVQRIFESISAQRGSAYTANPNSIVGAETMAYARAIAFDAWGANQRLANSFIPSRMQLVTGMLQRWEKIFGVPPLPGDTELVRRARVAAAWAKFGQSNAIQPVIDALQAAIAPIYVEVVHQNSFTGVSYVNGISNVVATGTAPPIVTFSGTPTDNFQIQLNVTSGGPLGTGVLEWSYDGGRTFPATAITIPTAVLPSLTGDVPLAIGTVNMGITAHFQPGTYATDNVYQVTVLPAILWTSTLAHLDVHVSYAGNGYHNTDGSPNAAFYALAANISPILDELLPSWATYSWYVNSTHGQMEFLLDEKNLDLEAFGLGALPSFPGLISGLAFRFRSDLGVTPGATFTWADQSGNGNNATQSTGVQQPTLTYGGINGLPYLAWGAAINLKATIAALAQPCEFFVVFATTAPGTVQYILDTGTNSQNVYIPDGTFKTFAGIANIGSGVGVSANVVHRGNVQLNGASTNVILDAGSPGTGNPGANSGTTTLTVGNYGGGGNGLLGGLYEVFAYSGILTSVERAAVVSYLIARYT